MTGISHEQRHSLARDFEEKQAVFGSSRARNEELRCPLAEHGSGVASRMQLQVKDEEQRLAVAVNHAVFGRRVSCEGGVCSERGSWGRGTWIVWLKNAVVSQGCI